MKHYSGLLKHSAAAAATLIFSFAVPSVAFCASGGGGHASLPPVWLASPFVLLLLMIATGPLFYPRFWEHHYQKVSIVLGASVTLWYAFMVEHGGHMLLHTLEEYISFIVLIASLFVVAGGILVKIERRGTPVLNAILLLFGAVLANVVGTTGASMLLIRPYLRVNEGRLKPFHIVFFIFIVSNIGGALTPIGDPPLFLGFLRGVPFFWVFQHLWLPWLLTVLLLVAIFLAFDVKAGRSEADLDYSGRITLIGRRNFLYLIPLIGSIFLDPAVIEGFPSLQEMLHVPFGIREVIMLTIAVVAYKTANQDALGGNEFNFEPIREVAFLFVGIFATMIPALQLIGAYAQSHAADFTVTKFYWFTGILSGVLDNAPTYLNFLAGALGKFGLDSNSIADVVKFAWGMDSPVAGDVSSRLYLMAISVAAVFFGAMTYIGNAPNFMVKNIAEQTEADVPSFVEYIYRYSIPVLLPVFGVIWFILFHW
ncbi:citrate transporter [Chlorobaculum sp. 24CR]|uniref:sodium:proton antiporter n=1 Tax=Chlorobaculum sp. 24CR TaxID=2508878 RepID=UPI00100A3757|nr:citrate transporter [Chlorobaculum sp. 24CR]